MKKNINHKNVESCWLEEYEYSDIWKGILETCSSENSEHSIENVFGGVLTMTKASAKDQSVLVWV